MNNLISIIVPVYNAEKFLNECIESIINQDYSNWELILIDDGSTDSSGSICDEYVKSNKKISCYHQTNHGVSFSRNFGVKHSRGEWITFIDADDYVDRNYLSNLLVADNYDMIVGGYNIFGLINITNSLKVTKSFRINANAFQNFDCNENSPYINVLYYICSKLYKRRILIDYQIIFDNRMKLAEDTCFNLRYLCCCNSLLMIPNVGYHYRCYSIVRKHSLDFEDFRNHYYLFDNLISFVYKSYNYKFNILNIQIYKAFFEALHEHLRKDSKDNFVLAANKLKDYILLEDLYPLNSRRNIFLRFIYRIPQIGFYIMNILYRIKK